MPPRSDLYLSSGRMRRTAFLLPLTTAALTPKDRYNGAISGRTCSAPPVRNGFGPRARAISHADFIVRTYCSA
jgi:hypothetical protein